MESSSEHVKRPDLADRISKLAARDQEVRPVTGFDANALHEADAANRAEFKEILAELGHWPTAADVGESAALEAFQIAQHSDTDTLFQRECLELMKTSKEGTVDLTSVGLLEDRVRRASHLPQLYGTQFGVQPDGKFGPDPIEDLKNLDVRRLQMGMEPFEEYRAYMLKQRTEWEARNKK